MTGPSDIDGIWSLVVTTDDGTLFHVSPFAVGGPNAPFPPGQRVRWMIRGTDGVEHVGPPIAADHSPAAVQHFVNAWWIAQQAKDRIALDEQPPHTSPTRTREGVE